MTSVSLLTMSQELHVFIVDDDEGSRKSVEALVEPMQVSVHSYDSAEAFLQNYRNQRPACLVTDQRMPGLSGIQLLETLRDNGITISLVVMTAYADTRSTVRAMLGGAMNLIEKPCNPQELWDAIQKGLQEDAKNYREELELKDASIRMANLTEGERAVIELLAQGNANKVVASRLGVSLRTVEARRASIFNKLGVKSIAELMKIWLKARDA